MVDYIEPNRLHSAPRGVVETLAQLDVMIVALEGADPGTNLELLHNTREIVRLVAEGINWTYCQNEGGPNPALVGADPNYPAYEPFRPYTP